MANELQNAFNEIAEVRELAPEVVLEALQSALVSAYRKYANVGTSQAIEARFDPVTGRAAVYVEKEVTDVVISPTTEVTLEKARFYNPECQMGDLVMVQEEGTTKKFGRIAAQTAKQVILQKIRESERNALYEEFSERQGDIMTGTVQSVNNRKVTLSLGRTEAVLLPPAQIPGERYRPHEKVRIYIQEVKKQNKGPEIVVSRSHRNMLRRLLEYEVPEIYNGQVEIKSIAREAGYRSKVAVVALQEGIDPVGACVGMRGIRIQNIVKELHDEKIDVIEWSPQAELFISKALSPARVTGVYLEDDITSGRTALVVVPDDQLSLAIGKEGQNARLAAKLTNWRIDIKSVSETVQGALDNLDVPPLSELLDSHYGMVEEARRIMAKRAENKATMPEEFNLLAKFADVVERKLLKMRDEIRKAEQAHVEAVKSTLPPTLFEMPVATLGLDETLIEALEPLGSVGQVMLAMLIDENRLKTLLSRVGVKDSIEIVQARLDEMMTAELDAMMELPAFESAVPSEAPAPSQASAPVVNEETGEEEVILDAFGNVAKPVVSSEAVPEAVVEGVATAELSEFEVDDDDDDDLERKRGDKKGKNKARELVFDEDRGAMRAKRKRKDNRKRGAWDDFEY